MNEIQIDQVLHIYNETLYTNIDFKASHELLKGSFQQKILILISKEDNLPENQELLAKMLAACKLQEADYQISMLLEKNEVLNIINQLNPETVILFGLSLNNEAFNAQKNVYKPFRFNNIKFLLSNSLSEVSANAAMKSSLWTTGLKPLFNIQ
jgi:DNA polymerase III psi subunit